MKVMIKLTTKEFLSQTFLLEKEIKAKQETLIYLDNLKSNITPLLEKERIKKTINVSRLQDIISTSIDLEREYLERIENLMKLQADIAKLIESIADPRCRLVLSLRYLNLKKWEEIAEELHYSLSALKKIHRCALKKFQRCGDSY